VQEEGSLPSERSGEGGAKRRSAQAGARKIRVPLARARGGAPQRVWRLLLGWVLRGRNGSLRNSVQDYTDVPHEPPPCFCS
jgi:hypothetical protein